MDLLGGTWQEQPWQCEMRGRAIIRDQVSKICEGINKLHFLVAYIQWEMVGGVRGYSYEFGLRSADLPPHKMGFFL